MVKAVDFVLEVPSPHPSPLTGEGKGGGKVYGCHGKGNDYIFLFGWVIYLVLWIDGSGTRNRLTRSP